MPSKSWQDETCLRELPIQTKIHRLSTCEVKKYFCVWLDVWQPLYFIQKKNSHLNSALFVKNCVTLVSQTETIYNNCLFGHIFCSVVLWNNVDSVLSSCSLGSIQVKMRWENKPLKCPLRNLLLLFIGPRDAVIRNSFKVISPLRFKVAFVFHLEDKKIKNTTNEN